MWESFEELGQVLRTEREKKYLSVEDVADGLKISARVLRAIEAGDMTSLPHAVYVRGFVSAYGKFLELDVQELLASPALYDDEEMPKASSQESIVVQSGLAKRKTALMLALGIVALCILVGLGLGGLWLYNNTDFFDAFKETHAHMAEPAPSQESEAKRVQSAKNSVSADVKPSSKEEKSEQAIAQAVQQEKPEQAEQAKQPELKEASENLPDKAVEPASGQNQGVSQPVLLATSGTENIQGPHKIIVTALVNTWLHSMADGAGMREFSLKPGDTFALTFDTSLQLKLGNAGGVRIHYNGFEMPQLGKNGEEKTVSFPPR